MSKIIVNMGAVLLAATASAQTTLVTVGAQQTQGNAASSWMSVSADGSKIIYYSQATNLVSGDTNGVSDCFVAYRDGVGVGTTRVSIGPANAQANGACPSPSGPDRPSISRDGTYVAFTSLATNLDSQDTNAVQDVYRRIISVSFNTTKLVSRTWQGGAANGPSQIFTGSGAISDDGRFIVFQSDATNLVPGDTNNGRDVFVSDMGQNQTVERVSVATGGAQANDHSQIASISPDGRYVVFESGATNLAPGGPGISGSEVYLRDRQAGTTELISAGPVPGQGTVWFGGIHAAMTPDARYVVFATYGNIAPGDTGFDRDIYLRDRQTASFERISVSSNGTAGTGGVYGSFFATISADGRFVLYESDRVGLVPGDTNGTMDVFLRDRLHGTTQRVSLSSSGQQSIGDSTIPALLPVISSNGLYAVFTSSATNLVASDTNGVPDGFERPLACASGTACTPIDDGSAEDAVGYFATNGGASAWLQSFGTVGEMTTVSAVATAWGSPVGGSPINGTPAQAAIWDDPNDDGDPTDCVLLQLVNGTVAGSGTNQFQSFSLNPPVTVSGIFFVGAGLAHGQSIYPIPIDRPMTCAGVNRGWIFGCNDNCSLDFANLANYPPDSISDNFDYAGQLLVRPVCGGSTVFCVPGQAGVIACPCSNPGLPGHGCENSSGTGGALLGVAGSASLAADTLVFTSTGEKPTAISILLQGTLNSASGAVFGQGVRCTAGTLKRLYTKTAVNGSITAPAPGDPSVSSMSATLGDPLSVGATRYYQVYYRDPIVPGGCPPSATFNLTQGHIVTWM